MRGRFTLAAGMAFAAFVGFLCMDGRTGHADTLDNSSANDQKRYVQLAQEKRRGPVFYIPLPPEHRHSPQDLQPIEPQSGTRQDPRGSLTLEKLKNGEYRPETFEYRSVRLTNGSYQEEVDDSGIQARVYMADKISFGDLNGDGIGDAALILVSSTGGSGVFYELVAVTNQQGNPIQAAAIMLGDRTDVRNLAIRSGRIEVERIKHGPKDPMCCPTLRVRETYRLRGGSLALSR